MPAWKQVSEQMFFYRFTGCYYGRLPANINLPQRNKIIISNDFCKKFRLKNGVNKRENEFEREMPLGFLLLYFRKGT